MKWGIVCLFFLRERNEAPAVPFPVLLLHIIIFSIDYLYICFSSHELYYYPLFF